MSIDIDEHSGFCFGVTNAIRQAEEGLKSGPLYCLGDIVHNGEECARLEALGLETIDYDDLRTLHGGHVLFRAHGEPPATYRIAAQNGMKVTDATCPVVLKLQQRIREAYTAHPEAQIVIYGQPGHAEVIGLCGQTNNNAIVVEHEDDLQKIDFTRPIYLFSQTTKSVEGFQKLVAAIEEKGSTFQPSTFNFTHHDTICRNVSNRVQYIREFASAHDIVIFVGGKKSSNAKVLFAHCQDANPRSVFVSGPEDVKEALEALDLQPSTFNVQLSTLKIGITGATSTPQWLMEQVKERIEQSPTFQP